MCAIIKNVYQLTRSDSQSNYLSCINLDNSDYTNVFNDLARFLFLFFFPDLYFPMYVTESTYISRLDDDNDVNMILIL